MCSDLPERLILQEHPKKFLFLISANSNYLSANFINVTTLDSAVNLLPQLKDQLVWLRLSDQSISDDHLTKLSSLKAVRKLWLDHTANINGTKISASGVEKLQPLKHLRNIYLFETSIVENQIQPLQAKFPNTQLEIGNYTVPTLATDTITVKAPLTVRRQNKARDSTPDAPGRADPAPQLLPGFPGNPQSPYPGR